MKNPFRRNPDLGRQLVELADDELGLIGDLIDQLSIRKRRQEFKVSISLDSTAIGTTINLKAVPEDASGAPTVDPSPIVFTDTTTDTSTAAGSLHDNGDGTASFSLTAGGSSAVSASDGTIISVDFDITVAAPVVEPNPVASIVIEQV